MILAVWNLWQWKYVKHLFSMFSYKIGWNDFFIPWKLRGERVMRYYHGFTRHELHSLLHQAGFGSIALDEETTLSPQGFRKRNYIVRVAK